MSSFPAGKVSELSHESRFLTLCRMGFIGRGLLYILIGVLVLGTGRTEDLTGALEYLNEGSGRLLLMGITAGLTAYGLWRLADAAFGIEHPGSGNSALRKRVAAGVIGFIYLYLSYKALRILLAGSPGDDGARQQADTVLDLPGGWLILGIAALILIGAGLNQLWIAAKCPFLRSLDQVVAVPLVKWLGRIGHSARGLIFILVGLLIAQAALDGQSTEAGGMEQALDLLSGPVLYAVAAGLILFGVFSVIQGLFRDIKEPPIDEMKQDVRDAIGR